MKYLVSQLSGFLYEGQVRQNLVALLRYLIFVLTVIIIHSVLFHFIMVYEGEQHSWVTGFYWTLTVMTTLGFGDITFHSDIGRLFSMLVLISGIVLLLIMLPFAFIRYFYGPWLEAQVRSQAPRGVPPDTKDHVIICRYDSICPGLIRKLDFAGTPYFVIEPDPVAAVGMVADGISVVTGEIDGRMTYESLRAQHARMVFVNADDAVNTNITLTVREVDSDVPIVALAEEEASVDILELSEATHVLPLKRRLGEQLAARIAVGAGSAYVLGRFKDLLITEFPAHDTPLVGKNLRQIRLRERTGVSVVGVWEQGRMQPVHADLRLTRQSVPVTVGSEADIARLNELLGVRGASARPVLVIGGGKVGCAAARALKERGLLVHMVEKDGSVHREMGDSAVDRLVVGDAADLHVLQEAGLDDATAVVLTTNDDAVNIYLTVYCRRLKPDLRVVSRLTRERNIEAIYRAGADSVLSYSSLGREEVISLILGREPILVGEGADIYLVRLPRSLVGKSLDESEIGARTGLIVIAVEDGQDTVTNPPPSLVLPADCRILMIGTSEQREAFARSFG